MLGGNGASAVVAADGDARAVETPGHTSAHPAATAMDAGMRDERIFQNLVKLKMCEELHIQF
jgi:phage/plasmid primase-like uncharacterized protein